MAQSNTNLDDLIKIFEKTFEDKKFSRNEKSAVSQLLEQDYSLKKEQRALLRDKIFAMARSGIEGHLKRDVIDWLETANKLLLIRQDTSAFFSPGEECKQLIIQELNRTLISVDICVFTISDDDISQTILDCHKRNVKVRIISDDEKVDDPGSDVYSLAASGIATRIDNSPHHMHHKFAVFDNRLLLTGSYNWTRSAGEYNHENILLTDDNRAVSAYKDEFEKLWNSFCPL